MLKSSSVILKESEKWKQFALDQVDEEEKSIILAELKYFSLQENIEKEITIPVNLQNLVAQILGQVPREG